jgi:long-chain acyl-CoA synthetase
MLRQLLTTCSDRLLPGSHGLGRSYKDTAVPRASSDEPGVISGDRFVATTELEDRARRVASGLRGLGVGPGIPVAVLGRNGLVHLEVALAAAQLGTSVVPVNWHWQPDEVRYVLQDCGAAVLVGHADLMTRLMTELGGSIGTVATVWQATPEEITTAFDIPADAARVPASRTDYEAWLSSQIPLDAAARNAASSGLFYTSGTTGRPKGVVREGARPEQVVHRQRALTVCYGITEACRTLVTTPLHHIFGQSMALATLATGGTVVIMPRFDAETFLSFVERHRITNASAVPTMFVRLLRLPDEVRLRYDVSSLRHVLHTGAPCPVDIKRAMLEWWGPVLWEQYGSTETGVIVLASPDEWLSHPGTVGRPFLTSEVRIYDDDGKELTPGHPGHIYGRMHGSPDFTYLGRPEAKAEVSIGDLVTAGDIGFVDEDGFLYLSDRSADVVISGGVNIYPAEIDAVLVTHPGVRDAVSFGVPDEDLGERVAAWVQLEEGADVTTDDLDRYLQPRLARYKIPRSLRFVEELPRDDSGKISRTRVRAEHQR